MLAQFARPLLLRAGLVDGLLRVGARALTSSSGSAQAEAALAHDPAPIQRGEPSPTPATQQPRWLTELGVVRTDWTWVPRMLARLCACRPCIRPLRCMTNGAIMRSNVSDSRDLWDLCAQCGC
jgi:hypothetical protein